MGSRLKQQKRKGGHTLSVTSAITTILGNASSVSNAAKEATSRGSARDEPASGVEAQITSGTLVLNRIRGLMHTQLNQQIKGIEEDWLEDGHL